MQVEHEINPAFEHAFGYSVQEVERFMAADAAGILRLIAPGDWPRVLHQQVRMLLGAQSRFTIAVTCRHKVRKHSTCLPLPDRRGSLLQNGLLFPALMTATLQRNLQRVPSVHEYSFVQIPSLDELDR